MHNRQRWHPTHVYSFSYSAEYSYVRIAWCQVFTIVRAVLIECLIGRVFQLAFKHIVRINQSHHVVNCCHLHSQTIDRNSYFLVVLYTRPIENTHLVSVPFSTTMYLSTSSFLCVLLLLSFFGLLVLDDKTHNFITFFKIRPFSHSSFILCQAKRKLVFCPIFFHLKKKHINFLTNTVLLS